MTRSFDKALLGVPTFGLRNKIINGDMRVSQRGSLVVNPGGSGNVYTAADRWSVSDFFGTTGQLSTGISVDVPVGQGFSRSLLIQCTTTLSLDFGSTRVRQRIEGFNSTELYNSDVTVSFWVKSSVAGLYTVQLSNGAYDRIYSTQITINAANTWEKKTLTIPLGDGTATGTWDTATGAGLAFVIQLAASATTGAVETWGSNAGLIVGQAAWGTVGSVFRITGVQIEKGSVATPFEQRHIGVETTLCQRYYEGGGYNYLRPSVANTMNYYAIPFEARKRVTPTVTRTYSGELNFTSGVGPFNVNTRAFETGLQTSAAGGNGYAFLSYTADAEL
jgi:hypothetical protein